MKHDFDKHHVDLMVGHENYAYLKKLTYGMNTGMSVSGNYTMGNFTTNSYYLGYDDEYKTESYLSRARYTFDDKYFVEASFRRDGSSDFILIIDGVIFIRSVLAGISLKNHSCKHMTGLTLLKTGEFLTVK